MDLSRNPRAGKAESPAEAGLSRPAIEMTGGVKRIKAQNYLPAKCGCEKY